MIRISKLADYACVIMQYMARRESDAPSAAHIAERTDIALPTVRKLLKQLSQSDLLVSTRGVGGGYTMKNEPQDISLIHIIEAVDGPVALTDCCTDKGCQMIKTCSTKQSWRDINAIVVEALNSKSLADLLHMENTHAE